MADITYSDEVMNLINIQKGLYLMQDLADKGLISSEDFDKFKKDLNDKTHTAIKALISSLE